jgi:hypothetical protein
MIRSRSDLSPGAFPFQHETAPGCPSVGAIGGKRGLRDAAADSEEKRKAEHSARPFIKAFIIKTELGYKRNLIAAVIGTPLSSSNTVDLRGPSE